MSYWGLKYKKAEPLKISEWNTLVDALDELNTRTPKKLVASYAIFSGDGTTTEFQIEHGLNGAPTCVICGKGAPDLPDIDYWTSDGTYITVVFKSPPSEGIDNVKIWYFALIT